MRSLVVFVAGIGFLFFGPQPAQSARGPGTLDDLKNIEITCFVPSWLPAGFKVTRVAITFDEPGPNEGGGRFPLYNIEYENDRKQTFSVDSAREGIGDRNLLDTDDSEALAIPSPLGRMYVTYTPKGQGKGGRKTEIKSNWTPDANMVVEKRKDPQAHPVLGRYHGFSATGITLAQFQRIINSLRPTKREHSVSR
jgi:hypothetical protein